MTGNTDFDLFKISEDHEALREAVRAVADDKIAPHAAEVDEKSEFPQAALDALVAADFHAPHIAEQYDGVGADALATCIVIEEVARACASSSLIPAVNKLGSMPVILGGSAEILDLPVPSPAQWRQAIDLALTEFARVCPGSAATVKLTVTRGPEVAAGLKKFVFTSSYVTVGRKRGRVATEGDVIVDRCQQPYGRSRVK